MRFSSPSAHPQLRRRRARGPACALALLACLSGPAALGSAPPAPVHPQAPAALDIASLGGALQEAQQSAFFAPFTASTHIPLHVARWDGSLAALQDQARSGSGPAGAGLAIMDDSAALAGCAQGLLLPIDPSAIPALTTGTAPLDVDSISPCGIGAFRTALVLAWDKSRIDIVPTWSAFWDVARRPGKRGLARDPRGTLEIALLADGVAPDALYRTLGSDSGLDRAFRKLDQLKPYVVWWQTPAQAVQIIETGAVLMTSAPNGEIAVANRAGHRDFGIQWQQSLSAMLDWVLPGRPPPVNVSAGPSDREKKAYALLGFMLDPARQADFVAHYPAQSLLRQAPLPDTALPSDSAEAADHERDATRIDAAFWAAHMAAIQARFDAWIAR